MDFIASAVELNWIGKLIYNGLFKWVSSWGSEIAYIGAFAITVILFTVFLKTATLPLDFWQKSMARKNAKKMDIMRPELDKLAKQCGDNKELYMQKQRETYKKYKYSMLSSCLPTILTLVIFIVIFSGFNSAVRYHNYKVFDELSNAYNETYSETITEIKTGENASVEEIETAIKAAEDKVLELYKPERFLLTQNIFMPDTWKNPIPTIGDYSGRGIGKLNIGEVDKNNYERVMKPLFEKYNKTENGKSQWNGYLLLPVMAFALSMFSSKLIKPPEQPPMAGQTEEQIRAQKSQAKVMAYMMPLMFSIFSLFYSTAFTLYMVVSNIYSTAFNLLYNIISKKVDEKDKDYRLSTTIKK